MKPETRPPGRRLQPQLRVLLGWLVILSAYRLWAVHHFGITLYVDEAQYWTWAQAPAWGYFSKPPMIAWLIAASTALFGDGLLAVKLPALVLYAGTALLLYQLGRNLFEPRVGLRVALGFTLIPLVSALGLFVSTDAPLLFFWALALYALVRAVEDDRWGHWLLLGLAVGLGLLSKYTMAAFLPSALLFLLLDPARRRLLRSARLWSAVLLAGLCLSPNLLWNWEHDFPTFRHTADITHIGADAGVQQDYAGNLGEFLAAQALSLGPLYALALLVGVYVALRARREWRMQLLLCFTVPLLLLVCLQALRSEANGNWAAPALLAGLLLAVAWLTRDAPRWLHPAALAINVVLMLGVYHLGDAWRLTGEALPARLDPLKRARGWDALADALRPHFQAYPHAILLAENRTVLAHMLYELRDQQPAYAEWNPLGSAADHYQLTASLDGGDLGRDALLLTDDADWSAIAARFAQAQPLQQVQVEAAPGLERSLNVVLLRGFRGYR